MLAPIHPFPARMAPDIAQESLRAVVDGGRVLDPMCGSGTVLRAAVEAGITCTGVDIDPLAVLMARVWVTPLVPSMLLDAANAVVERARDIRAEQLEHISDAETQRLKAYWFASRQRNQLHRLATVLRELSQPEKDALEVALSRTIVTKEMKASLARDTSHSRPHRVASENSFDVFEGFLKEAAYVAKRLAPKLIRGKADVFRGDARALKELDDETFDLVVTSPPYLNAIDYLRGHKLTLVWLEHELSAIRTTRSASIGAESVLANAAAQVDVARYVVESSSSRITDRHLGWLRRYAVDMQAVFGELSRVVKQRGTVVMVVGNSFLRGAVVNNAMLVERIAQQSGFQLEDSRVRSIPARRRYLPPPGNGKSMLDTRMREETVLKFRLQECNGVS